MILLFYHGDLGSGKTKFTMGILKHFDLEKEISSPTFTIVNEHHIKNLNIYHFDVYRLENTDEFLGIGGDEYFSNGICIIEWGEKIESILPKDYLKITFDRYDEDEYKRNITITAVGNNKKYLKILEALEA